jgi:hypothetical protein
MNIELQLHTDNDEIDVIAKLNDIDITNDNITFLVNHLLNIKRICHNNNAIDYSVEEANELFRKAKKIILKNENYANLIIEYGGKVDGYHTIINNEICAINYYSCWYPDNFNINVNSITVKYYTDNYNQMINGHYNKNRKYFEYTPLDFDCNILALNNARIISDCHIDICYFGRNNDKTAKIYSEEFNKSLKYCMELYKSKRVEKVNLCILPEGNKYDGYTRKRLIVLGGFNEDIERFIHLITHEIAHNWCTGANILSWEDWLNETTAEWTALLYDLEKNRMGLFSKTIDEKLERIKNYSSIKTKDGNRPDGVHEKGTILFYNIYKQYGIGTIKQLLTIYNNVKEKNTEEYLNAINHDLPEIANIIRQGIEK